MCRAFIGVTKRKRRNGKGKFGKFQNIDKLYAPKETLPENKDFVRINNKETLAQVFTDLRYTRKDNEAMSETLKATLKRQGFIK